MKYPELDDDEIYRILDGNQAMAAQEAGGYPSIDRNPLKGVIFVRHFCYLLGMSTLRRLRAMELRVQELERMATKNLK